MRSMNCWGVTLALAALTLSVFPSEGLNAQEPRDFLFGQPRVTLSLNMGYGVALTGSDIFDEYLFRDLTLGKSDFSSPTIGAGAAVYLNDRVDLTLDFGYSRSETWSEYRHWVDLDDLPIEQRTTLTRVPLTVGARYFLLDRGRQISRFAWIPAKWSPYLGAGVGRIYYKLDHVGDFIDLQDENLPVFSDAMYSEGSAWTASLLAGAQLSLHAHFVITAEGRYSWAEADLDREYFSGWQPLDLSGYQGTVGFGVRF